MVIVHLPFIHSHICYTFIRCIATQTTLTLRIQHPLVQLIPRANSFLISSIPFRVFSLLHVCKFYIPTRIKHLFLKRVFLRLRTKMIFSSYCIFLKYADKFLECEFNVVSICGNNRIKIISNNCTPKVSINIDNCTDYLTKNYISRLSLWNCTSLYLRRCMC